MLTLNIVLTISEDDWLLTMRLSALFYFDLRSQNQQLHLKNAHLE